MRAYRFPLAVVAIGLLLFAAGAVELPKLLAFLRKLGLFLGVPLLLMGWWSRRRLGAVGFQRLAARLVLLGLVSVTAVVAGEFAVRFALRDITSTNDAGSWFGQRWSRTVQSNPEGYRERSFARSAPEGTLRIAVIGDSLTWGQGVPREQRYTDRLQAHFDAVGGLGGRPVEVLNFGTPGDETTDHWHTVRNVMSRFDPDYVLLQWYWNDWEGEDKSGRPRARPLLPSSFLHKRLRTHSALYYLMQVQWGRLQSLGGKPGFENYLEQRFGDPEGEEAQRAQSELAMIHGDSRALGVPLGMVLFPHLSTEHRLGFLHDQVLEVCDVFGTECLDLAPQLGGRPDARELWANPFDLHPGAEAHRIAAESLLERFEPIWRELAETPAEDADADNAVGLNS